MSEALQTRGVHNPRVVDLITGDSEAGEVVLVMLEDRHWGEVEDHFEQLQEKFNAYLSYVQGQYLAQQYPQYVGLRVRIQLDCVDSPREADQPFLAAMQSFAEEEGIRFVLNVIQTDASAS